MVEGSSPPARALLTGGSRPCDKSRYLLPAPPDICKRGERGAASLSTTCRCLARERVAARTHGPDDVVDGDPGSGAARSEQNNTPASRAREIHAGIAARGAGIMKKASQPELLQRFLNVDLAAGGDAELAARRSKWIASGTEVLQAAAFVVSKLDSQKNAAKISAIMAQVLWG